MKYKNILEVVSNLLVKFIKFLNVHLQLRNYSRSEDESLWEDKAFLNHYQDICRTINAVRAELIKVYVHMENESIRPARRR